MLAWSRFGYGQSDAAALPRPLTYLHEEGRLVLPRVLDAAGVRRGLLLGHSDGASIAVIHAERLAPQHAGAVAAGPLGASIPRGTT